MLAEAIRATRKTLSAIYVTASGPDYYFGLLPIVRQFPRTRVLAAPSTVEAIRTSLRKEIGKWEPYLRDNGPRVLADIVMPEPYTDSHLVLEGNVIEIVEARSSADHDCLYVPSLDAVFGGAMLFGKVHVWVADTPTIGQRSTWVAELNALAARAPKIVVPGHMALGTPLDASVIAFTRDYLLAFEEECTKANGSEALIAAMTRHYPDAGMRVALAIGAKVVKGELNYVARSSVWD